MVINSEIDAAVTTRQTSKTLYLARTYTKLWSKRNYRGAMVGTKKLLKPILLKMFQLALLIS